jgi:hypothetical protein
MKRERQSDREAEWERDADKDTELRTLLV